MNPIFFATPRKFRAWLEEHHAEERELLVGFYKKGSGRASITWPESVDEALCFGWIDGVRRNLDEESYTIRFTPRKASSIWSAINIRRVEELTKLGRMMPAGATAFAKRQQAKSAIYTYEQKEAATLAPEFEKRFRRDKKAWAFFAGQAPWYRRVATHWVMRAKQAETRERRLAALLASSAAEKRLDQYTNTRKTAKKAAGDS